MEQISNDYIEGKKALEEELKDYPTMLTPDQVGEILQVGRGKVYELVRKEKIKGLKIGAKSLRITKQNVISYIIGGVFDEEE